ncbi:MAG: acetamidase/formamidase family protein [Methanomassiliicoccales archaeon]
MRLRGKINGHLRSNFITHWSPDVHPVLTLKDMQSAVVEIPEASTDQITRKSTSADIGRLDSTLTDAAVGPIYVEDAMPGDILRVDILEIKCDRWGWTGIIPGFGLLTEQFPEPRLYHWSITNGLISPRKNEFLTGLKLKARPFLGIVGVAPAEHSTAYTMIPPQYFGGNMDNRRICEGASVYFRVNVKGAMLCIADTHATQGDGEVCGTAVETPSRTTVRVRLFSDEGDIPTPSVIGKEDLRRSRMYSTSGIGSDLYQAAKNAVLSMVKFVSAHGVDQYEAYALCSVAGNLSISEIVDAPNWNVSFSIPVDILRQIGVSV